MLARDLEARLLRSPAQLFREAGRIVMAIMSQLLRASSTFIIPLIAVRLLNVAQFSTFNIIVAIFGFALAAFSSFASDPILTYFSKAKSQGLSRYVGLIDRFSIMAGVGVAAIFLALSLVAHSWGMTVESQAWLGLTLAAPPFFLAQARDRLAFAASRPHVALASNASAVAVSASLILAIALSSNLDVLGLLFSVAVGQWASYALYRINAGVPPGEMGAEPIDAREVLRHHLVFGRWAVGGQFLWWCMTNFFLFALPWLGDVEAAGKFRLIQSINMPATLAVGAAALFITPRLVRMNQDRARRFSFLFYGATLLLAPLYIVAMGVVSSPVLGAITDQKMHLTLPEAWIAGLAPIANGLLMFAVAAARARGHSALQVHGNLIGLAITVPVGVMLARDHGLVGALVGQCAGLGAAALGVEIMLGRRLSRG